MGVTLDDARAIAATLPRAYEALVRDEVRFRVGQIVYAAFDGDDSIMGFGFPKEEREALVGSDPDLLELVEETYTAFRNRQQTMVHNATCPCSACQSVATST